MVWHIYQYNICWCWHWQALPQKFFGCIQQAAKSDAKVVSRTFQSAIAECAVRKGEGERDLSQKWCQPFCLYFGMIASGAWWTLIVPPKNPAVQQDGSTRRPAASTGNATGCQGMASWSIQPDLISFNSAIAACVPLVSRRAVGYSWSLSSL